MKITEELYHLIGLSGELRPSGQTPNNTTRSHCEDEEIDCDNFSFYECDGILWFQAIESDQSRSFLCQATSKTNT